MGSFEEEIAVTSSSLSYFEPIDVARRVSRRNPYWFHGEPVVVVEGEQGSFGRIVLDFGKHEDDPEEDRIVIGYDVYLKDKAEIERVAKAALTNDNFRQICMALFDEGLR